MSFVSFSMVLAGTGVLLWGISALIHALTAQEQVHHDLYHNDIDA